MKGTRTAFSLLVGLKARLLARSLLRGGGRRGGRWPVAGLVLLVLVLSPIWLGMAAAAHQAALRFGAEGTVAVLVAVHAGWLFSAFLFAAFTEGFELRMMLRYPVRPSTVFALNVLLAPLDLVALFLLPPLGAVVVATAQTTGAAAALAVGLAALSTLLLTGVVLQVLLAALGRFLRREWSRAIAGLLFGLVFAAPAVLVNRSVGREGGARGVLSGSIERALPATARLGRVAPTTALPALMVRGARAGQPLLVAAGALGTFVLLVGGVLVGTRWATAAALADQATARRPRGPHPRGAPRPGPATLALRLLGPELMVLVQRELRTWTRTPQILVGLLLTPVLVLFFFWQDAFSLELRLFFLPLFCLTSVFNVSANQYGLDREGVRLLFLLPVAPRRLIVAKNLASAAVVGAETALALLLVALLWRPPPASLAVAAGSVLATAPVVLIAGNWLSVRHPWRMTFRVGGTPPGALASALAQFLVVGAMAVLLAIPLLAGRLGGGPAAVLAGTAALALLAWLAWWLMLARAARALVARREHLLATLAHPHETG